MNQTIKKILCKYFVIPETKEVSLGSIGVMGVIYLCILYVIGCSMILLTKPINYIVRVYTTKDNSNLPIQDFIGSIGLFFGIVGILYYIVKFAFEFKITKCERDEK